MPAIIKPRDFTTEKVALKGMRETGNGGKMVYLNYEGEPLVVQTPELVLPFGLNAWPRENESDGGGQPQKYTLEMAIQGPSTKRFLDMLTDLDQKLLEEGMKNSLAWWKKQHKSVDVTDAVYKRIVKNNPNNDHPPLFKANIPVRDGKIMCDVFDGDKNPIDITCTRTKGARAMAIVQCTGVWLAGGNFGCTWKVLQLRIVPPAVLEGFAFDLDDEDEGGEREKKTNTANTTNTTKAKAKDEEKEEVC